MIKKSIIFLLFINLASFLFCSENYALGEEFFKNNNPEQAIPYFRMAINESNVDKQIYNFLGLSYYQVGKYQESLDTFLKGTTVSGTNKRQLFYNAGNCAFRLAQFDKAVEFFSYSLAADNNFSSAILNRANSYFKLAKYDDAINDYENFLILEPNTDQKTMIERLIALLKTEIIEQEQEKERIAEENKRIQIEEQKIAAEMAKYEEQRQIKAAEEKAEADRIAAEQAAIEAKRKEEEAERRRKLLEEVAQALQENASTNVSAGTEGVITYDYEEELD